MFRTNRMYACFVSLVWCATITFSIARDLSEDQGTIGKDATTNMSDYVMEGTTNSRAGLPEVKLWFKKSQVDLLQDRGTGWNYPEESAPTNMNYPSWRFWQFSVTDALLQVIFEQSTDPQGRAAKLGKYFSRLKGSSITCWSATPKAVAGLAIDLSSEIPLTESFYPGRYVTYGIGYHLFFNGSARFLLTVHSNRQVDVKLISSTLPAEATRNLTASLECLSGHPVMAFPENCGSVDELQVIAEFVIERKLGPLKKACFRPAAAPLS